MLRVSTRGEYGSRMMVFLARHWGERPVSLSEIAQHELLSVEYLEQLAVALRKAGLIESHRGMHGGYTLARSPERIKMGEILRTLEGSIAPMVCVTEGAIEAVCALEMQCSTRLLWLQVGKAIAGVLDSMTLAELVPVPAKWQPAVFTEEKAMVAVREEGVMAQHG
jgi:Rrf2 family protein